MKIDENYKWWKENRSKYIEKYKGLYVLVAEKRIIASDRLLNKLELLAKNFDDYIILSVGFTPPIEEGDLGFPFM